MSKESLKRILKQEFLIKGVVMIGLTPILLFIFMISGRSGVELYEAFGFVFYVQVILSVILYIVNRKKLYEKVEMIIYCLFQVIYSIIICSIITILYASFI